jgi:hypothetical protein
MGCVIEVFDIIHRVDFRSLAQNKVSVKISIPLGGAQVLKFERRFSDRVTPVWAICALGSLLIGCVKKRPLL